MDINQNGGSNNAQQTAPPPGATPPWLTAHGRYGRPGWVWVVQVLLGI